MSGAVELEAELRERVAGYEEHSQMAVQARKLTTLLDALATLRSDNERLGRECDADIDALHGTFSKPIAVLQERVDAAEAERDTLLAQVEALKVDLENRAEWHRCSCPEPCDDYGVFPGGCAGRYREDYRALIARAALTKEPS